MAAYDLDPKIIGWAGDLHNGVISKEERCIVRVPSGHDSARFTNADGEEELIFPLIAAHVEVTHLVHAIAARI